MHVPIGHTRGPVHDMCSTQCVHVPHSALVQECLSTTMTAPAQLQAKLLLQCPASCQHASPAACKCSCAEPGATALLSDSLPSTKLTLPRCNTAATVAKTASRCSGGMPTFAMAVTVRCRHKHAERQHSAGHGLTAQHGGALPSTDSSLQDTGPNTAAAASDPQQLPVSHLT